MKSNEAPVHNNSYIFIHIMQWLCVHEAIQKPWTDWTFMLINTNWWLQALSKIAFKVLSVIVADGI